jgi:hypothetical protein
MKSSTNSEERKHDDNEVTGEQFTCDMLRSAPFVIHGTLMFHAREGTVNSLMTMQPLNLKCGWQLIKDF